MAVMTLRTRRRPVRLADGQPVAELADDEVSVVEGRRVLVEPEPEALADGVDSSRRWPSGCGRPGRRTPSRSRRSCARSGRVRLRRPYRGARTGPNPTMADALASLADNVGRLIHHDPLARLGRVEGVHQVRVALRRLRSDLRTLQAAVDPAGGRRSSRSCERSRASSSAATRTC